MTSSALDTSDALNTAIESLTLPSACTAKLSHSQIENMKTNVVFANQSMDTAGNAIRATAECLYEIKSDVKNKNWTALTESGVLNMSGRMARDLVKAHETWLEDSDVPDSALAKVSARMLARIGSVKDAGKRNHAINKMKQGAGFTEQDLGKIIGNLKTPIRRQIDDLVAQAEKEGKAAPDKEKIDKYGDLLIENVKLNGRLEDQTKANSKLQKDVKDLKKENIGLRKIIGEAATELDRQQAERLVAK